MKPNKFLILLLISVAGAVLTSLIYVYAQYIWLPPSDGAYGIGFPKLLSDPFVLTVAFGTSIPVGIIAAPILYFFLRHKNLKIAYPLIQLLVIVVIFAVMPFHSGYAMIGSCAALLIGASFFWISPFARKE